jgi:hypothetical protein
MRYHDDPELLTAAERLQSVARILAAGVLRLHARAALTVESGAHCGPPNPSESGQDCLELPAETGLSEHTG